MSTFVLVLLLLGAAARRAEAADVPPVPATLEQQLDALDRTDAELAQLRTQHAAAATAPERQAAEARIQAVEGFQAELLKAIAQAVGAPPPQAAAAPAAPVPAPGLLEQQLEQQRQKDETLLDRTVVPD